MKDYFAKEVTVENLKKFRKDKKDDLSPKSIDMIIAFCGTAITYWNTLKKGQKVLSIAGTHSGVDTAVVAKSSGYEDFKSFEVMEILCKPYQRSQAK